MGAVCRVLHRIAVEEHLAEDGENTTYSYQGYEIREQIEMTDGVCLPSDHSSDFLCLALALGGHPLVCLTPEILISGFLLGLFSKSLW